MLQIDWVGGSGRDFQFVVALFPKVCSLARAFLISIHPRGVHLARELRAALGCRAGYPAPKAASTPLYELVGFHQI